MSPARGSPRGGRGRHSLADVVVELPLLPVQVRHRDVLQLLLHEAQPLLLHCNAERGRAGTGGLRRAPAASPTRPCLGSSPAAPAGAAPTTCLSPRPRERGPGRPLTQVQPLGGNPDPAAGGAVRGCGQAGQEEEEEEEAAAGSHLAPGGRAGGQRGPALEGSRGEPSTQRGCGCCLPCPRHGGSPDPRTTPGLLCTPCPKIAALPRSPLPQCSRASSPLPGVLPRQPPCPRGSPTPRACSRRLLRWLQRPAPNHRARHEPRGWWGSGEPSTARGGSPALGPPRQPRADPSCPPRRCAAAHSPVGARLGRELEPPRPAAAGRAAAGLRDRPGFPHRVSAWFSARRRRASPLLLGVQSLHPPLRATHGRGGLADTKPARFGYLQ